MATYKIVDFYTNEDSGISTDTFEEAYDIIRDLEENNTTRYIPILIGGPDDYDEDEIQ